MMKLIRKIKQHRRDFKGEYKCQGCGNIKADQRLDSYDDAFFHEKVIPKMVCDKCGESTNSLGVKDIVMTKTLTDDEMMEEIVKPIKKSWVVSFEKAINQEVRKALDSIEVLEKVRESDLPGKEGYGFNVALKAAEALGRNQAIDEYTANINSVKDKYE